MNKFISRNKALITFTFIFIVFFLGSAALLISGLINEKLLMDKKATVSFFFELVKLVIIITGAIIAYLRFFKGHLFLPKIDYEIKHQMISLSESTKMHFLDIEIKNIGDYTIYNPIVYVNTYYIPDVITSNKYYIKDGKGYLNAVGKKVNHVLRAKTTTNLAFDLKVYNIEVIALKFEVVIKLQKRIWKRTLIAENLG